MVQVYLNFATARYQLITVQRQAFPVVQLYSAEAMAESICRGETPAIAHTPIAGGITLAGEALCGDSRPVLNQS